MQLIAQETYTINEHGTYVLDTRRLIKVPLSIKEDQGLHTIYQFWENYAVFVYSGGGLNGIAIFNIENGSTLEIMDESFYGLPRIIEDDTYFAILHGDQNNDYIFKFDKVTLELVEKTYVGSLFDRERYLRPWEPVTIEKIGERTVRYITNNNSYIDVIYGADVEMREWWNFSVYYDGSLNRYTFFVFFYDGK
jgi:hypothetical protein